MPPEPEAAGENVTELPDVTKPFDPEPERELWRHRLAFGLLLMVAGTIIGGFVWIAAGWASEPEIVAVAPKDMDASVSHSPESQGF